MPLPLLELLNQILALNLFKFLLKNVVELTLKILLHHGLLRLLPAYLIFNVVLILLYAHSLNQ